MANQVSMIIGNALYYRQGLDRFRAMRTAWAMLKQGTFYTRLAGVTLTTRRKRSWPTVSISLLQGC